MGPTLAFARSARYPYANSIATLASAVHRWGNARVFPILCAVTSVVEILSSRSIVLGTLQQRAVGPGLNPCHTRVASLQRSQSVLKLQIAKERAVQSHATLCTRCMRSIPSPKTPCTWLCGNARDAVGNSVCSPKEPWARSRRAACELWRRCVNPVFGGGVCNLFW